MSVAMILSRNFHNKLKRLIDGGRNKRRTDNSITVTHLPFNRGLGKKKLLSSRVEIHLQARLGSVSRCDKIAPKKIII